jgi:hypothetical protein
LAKSIVSLCVVDKRDGPRSLDSSDFGLSELCRRLDLPLYLPCCFIKFEDGMASILRVDGGTVECYSGCLRELR